MTARPAVVVMVKAPHLGTAKSRLLPLLGRAGCARLASVLLAQAAATALEVSPGGAFVAVHPPQALAALAAGLPAHHLVAQRGGHLGERMAEAAGAAFAAGYGPVAVIGTDVPLLAPDDLRRAFDVLGSGCDVVFGPAHDGGYYLVGLARPLPAVFEIAPHLWGGPLVLDASLEHSRRAGLEVGLLTPLPDLDTPDDARAALADMALPAAVRAVLTRREPATSAAAETT
ncbi:MAG: TIGR04282 family arsenosugar biosynthesis glycosyltransferase [Actinomycetota bacterium]|nr:TIGR04282 family arsenosugar biosynthesis glycosyltransferase [Actinomycetota bacterium]